MFKIMNTEVPQFYLILLQSQQTMTTKNNHIPNYHCRTDCFKYSSFPSTFKYWFNLNASIRNSESLAIFKSRLLSFTRSIQRNVYNIFDPVGLKLLTCLRLGCSHVIELKCTDSFHDWLNHLYYCKLEIEDMVHYLLHSHHFSQYCFDLKNSVKSVFDYFESFSDNV